MKSHPNYKLMLLLFFFLPFQAMANFEDSDAYITQVRGQRAIIDPGSSKPKVGDIFIAYDNNGKRKGILKIIKVSRSQALAQIVKGTARLDWAVGKYQKKPARPKPQPKPRPQPKQELDFEDEEDDMSADSDGMSSDDSDDAEETKPSKFKAGIMAGYNMNSMTVGIPGDELTQVSMSGNSTGFYAFAIYELMPKIDVFASIGQEKFDTTGEVDNEACDGSNDCVNNSPYLAASILGRYKVTQGEFAIWVGGGLSFLKPGTVESNVLDPESVKGTLVYSFGGGVDWGFQRNLTIPVLLRYNIFPPAENVKASYISIQAGVAYHF